MSTTRRPTGTTHVLRPFNRSVHLWLSIFAVVGFTYFGVQAVLFNLYRLRLGFEPQFIGLLIGSGQVVFAVTALPSGEFGRRVAVHGATRNVFSQQIVGTPWRTTIAAILTIGMGLGWASSAAVGGLLLAAVDFSGLFYLTGVLVAVAAIVTWGYQRAGRVRVPLAERRELKGV